MLTMCIRQLPWSQSSVKKLKSCDCSQKDQFDVGATMDMEENRSPISGISTGMSCS